MEKITKALGLTGLLLVSVLSIKAQSGDPSWIISKDVQRVANKKMLTDDRLKNSHVQARSVDFPAIVVSKGIARTDTAGDVSKGNVVSAGYPAWTISKGIHRISRK